MRSIHRMLGLLLVAALLASCSLAQSAVPAQVTELSATIDEYLTAYQEQFQLSPRPAKSALASVEMYLQEYQPVGPLPRVFQTTYLYDRNGERLAEIFEEGYRTWIPLSRISPYLIDAVIATEDSTFYSNPGFDPRRVVGALMQNAEAGDIVSGASTITMQLARQIFFRPEDRIEQTMERKVFELLLAQDLTNLFSKDEIMEMYLNLVYFGRLAYGVEAASQVYFGKTAAVLTQAEATLIAGIPQMPGHYDLLTNFEAVKQRQRIVLDLLVRHGYLSVEEADAIYSEAVKLNPDAGYPPVLAPHFVQYVTDYMNRRLGGLDVRRAGLRIFTTVDLRMQDLAQKIVAEQVEQLRPRFNLSNAALVALRPGTAEILTMVGSADFDNPAISGQVNVAVRQRQPGSAIKPVLYATALENRLISPASILWDLEAVYKLSETDTYRPRNYDETFHGPVTVRTALANSYNIPAVKMLDAVGIDTMLTSARAMGIQSLTRDTTWYGLSLTLGGGEVTLLDLTTAFHTLANQGRYMRPQAILFATGDIGEIYQREQREPEQVVSAATAFLVTDILSDNEARTAEFGANSALKLSRPAAAKTGTTSDYRDNWTMGYTRYLVAGVWAGNSDGRPMRNVSGVTGAAPIWNAFMEGVLADDELLDILEAPENPEAWKFEAPEQVVEQPISCPRGVVCPATEYFSQEWLALTGDFGPQSDSVITGTVRSVFAGRRQVGACGVGVEERSPRQLVRLPTGTAFVTPFSVPKLDEETTSKERREHVQQEQRAALNWGARTGNPLYLGPCDGVEEILRAVYGDRVGAIAIEDFAEQAPVASLLEEEEQFACVPVAATNVSSGYSLVGVSHEANCGGSFVLGQVRGAENAPQAGIQVIYSDDSGNVRATTTGGDGTYRIPIASDAPQNIYLTLVGPNGGAVSSAMVVPHKLGGGSDQPCHYANWGGAN